MIGDSETLKKFQQGDAEARAAIVGTEEGRGFTFVYATPPPSNPIQHISPVRPAPESDK